MSFCDLLKIQRELNDSIYDINSTDELLCSRGTMRRDVWKWHEFMQITALIEHLEGYTEFTFPNSPKRKRRLFSRFIGRKSAR